MKSRRGYMAMPLSDSPRPESYPSGGTGPPAVAQGFSLVWSGLKSYATKEVQFHIEGALHRVGGVWRDRAEAQLPIQRHGFRHQRLDRVETHSGITNLPRGAD